MSGFGAADLRVVMLVTTTAYAGLERHVVQLTAELRALGCDAGIVCLPTAGRMRAAARDRAVPVTPALGAPDRRWLRSRPNRRGRSRTVLHAHDGRSSIVAAVLGRLTGHRVVRTQHFHRPASAVRTGWRGQASSELQRQVNRFVAGYIAVSPSVQHAALARQEVGAAALAVIPPGIELAAAQAVEAGRSARLAADAPVFVYAGRLEPEKELDVLIRAIPQVLSEEPGCRFVIAGTGAAEAELKALAEREGVGHAVTWPGWVKASSAVLAGAHAYVNTWPWEGFGMAMAEAMSFGLPVVAAASAGSRDLVEHGSTGLLYRPRDASSLAAALLRITRDRSAAEAMGQAGRRRAVAMYGVATTARSTMAFYEQILKRSA